MTMALYRTIDHVELLIPEIREPIARAINTCIHGMEPEAIVAALIDDIPDSVRQELAALLNPWRPIEGEAYSGKYVLVFRPNATTQKMRIGTDVWDTISSGTPCWWHSRPDEQPTRWLPLPAPPKEDKAT